MFDKTTIQKFANLFAGRTDAYGSLQGACIKRPVTLQVYARHLAGKESIGIYPLRDDGTCWFAAQDIDMKDDQAKAAEMAGTVKEALGELGIPVYIEKSKSKGYHVWVFFSEPVPAKDARRLLAGVWKKAVGGSVPEIFPKQDTLDGQTYGNYLHLPYFLPHSKENRRVMVDGGRVISLEEFLNSVKRVKLEQLAAALEKLPAEKEPPKKAAAPGAKGGHRDLLPCAKALVEKGADKGYRRPSLFRLAAHCHKAGYPQEIAEALIRQVDAKNDPPILKEFGEKELLHHLESAYNGKGGQGYTSLGCDDDAWTSRFCPGKESCPVFAKEARKSGAVNLPSGISAAELIEREFPEPTWVVPRLLPEGLAILAGRPKLGKSFLALNLALAVATGGVALGQIKVGKGNVVCLSLEDGPRRLQDRLKAMLGGGKAPEGLHFFTEFPRLDQGGLQALEEVILRHTPRLIILDTLARLRPPGRKNGNIYQEDYAVIGSLKTIADRHNAALLIVHHQNKADYTDILDTISGSTGISGAADTLLVFKRSRGKADAELFATGRDFEEKELALSFDNLTMSWQILGSAQEYRLSQERQEILELLREAGRPLSPKEVAAALGKPYTAIAQLLYRMSKTKEITAVGYGRYVINSQSSQTCQSGQSGQTCQTRNDSYFDRQDMGGVKVTEPRRPTAARLSGNFDRFDRFDTIVEDINWGEI